MNCFVDLFLVRDWLSLVPPTAAVAGLGYVSYMAFCPEARKSIKVARVNKLIRLEDAKVADFVDIEDIAEKAAFCRCWKSKNVCIIELTLHGTQFALWSHHQPQLESCICLECVVLMRVLFLFLLR